MPKIYQLLALYQKDFPFAHFYDRLLYCIAKKPDKYIQSDTFLAGYEAKPCMCKEVAPILTQPGDTRVAN